MRLIAKIPDQSLQELIRDQYYLDVEANANAAQVAFIDLVSNYDEKLGKSINDLKNMTLESINLGKEGGVALRQLRDDFQSVAEVVSGIVVDLKSVKKTVASHDREIMSFRESRDQSIAERKELQIHNLESKKDRVSIHEELHAMTNALSRIEELLSGVLPSEEIKLLIKTPHSIINSDIEKESSA